MPKSNEKNICRVCGLIQKTPPWGNDLSSPTHEICSCCGVEFGYEDCTSESVASYRRKWLGGGAQWSEHKNKPDNWELDEQLKNCPIDYN